MNKSQSGNALIIVLVTIALFGALIFTFTSSGEQGSGNLTVQQSRMAAQDIMAFARAVENAVNRLRSKSVSESDLDFRNDTITPDYENSNCGSEACQIFSANGGKAIWQSPPARANDGTEWAITGNIHVEGMGTDGSADANADLTLFLPNVNREVCILLNSLTNIPNPANEPPEVAGDVDYSTVFTGSFVAGDLVTHAALDGQANGCFENDNAYHFYYVLLAR